MHILSRIKPSQDPWGKVVLLSLQQFAEDMRINEKRIRALEKSIVVLGEAHLGSSSEGQQDLIKLNSALQDLHEEIRAWSKLSLDRAEELVIAIRQVVSDQELEPDISNPSETKRLAS